MEDVNAPRTFTARCRLCEYESVYAVRDIRKSPAKACPLKTTTFWQPTV
jgi:hypothetical protein